MNYFKAELLSRCRSLDDAVAEAAAQQWEAAVASYGARLKAIRSRLPLGARRLLARYSLHDAKVLSLAVGRKEPRFVLVVQLEGTPTQPGEVLELSYLSVAGPHGGVAFRKPTKPAPDTSGTKWVLYNEFDLDEERAFFTHSLLLTGGVEIEVRFHNLRVKILDDVFVSPTELPEAERTWPLVEV